MAEQALNLADFKSDISFLMSDVFSGAGLPVFHGFFGRRGGVSHGVYEGLNCGLGSEDDAALVLQNRALVRDVVGCEAGRLLSLYQVHGDVCLRISKGSREPWADDVRPEADSFVTDERGVALGILTADCAPVLFYGEKSDGAPVIGAAHAGWGGALRGVLGSCVEGMLELGALRESVRACVGPCIAQASYEVEEIFSAPFLNEDEENERFFKAGKRSGHLMFDLSGYCAFKLYKAGVMRVAIEDQDTYARADEFFSYRRMTHLGEDGYGRQISVIMIEAENL